MNLSKHDLKIELSPSQLSRAKNWLQSFYSKCKSRMSDPVIEDGILKISSADIYNFLMAIEIMDENRLDWQRLKSNAQKLLILQENKKRDPLIKEYYKNCRGILS